MKKILLVLACLLLVSRVNARVLTMDEVVNAFNHSSVIEEFETGTGLTVTATNDTDTNSIVVDFQESEQQGVIREYSYLPGYILLSNDSELTREVAEAQIMDSVALSGLLEAVLNICGHALEEVENKPNDFVYDFDRYNIYIESEPYTFTDTNGGDTNTLSGIFIRTFKLGFDTDKINTFVSEIQSPTNPGGDSTPDIDVPPTLKYKDRTKNSVSLSFYVEGAGAGVTCDVYRAEGDNGTYTFIGPFGCNTNNYVVDEGLEENKTYYYKAVVTGGVRYSSVLKVPAYSDENPDTGVNNVFPLLIGLVLSISALFIFQKNSKVQLQ